jgi:hypothetical protein
MSGEDEADDADGEHADPLDAAGHAVGVVDDTDHRLALGEEEHRRFDVVVREPEPRSDVQAELLVPLNRPRDEFPFGAAEQRRRVDVYFAIDRVGDCVRLDARSARRQRACERRTPDEEEHADWFESQLDAIERVGVAQYLAQQIDPGAAPG